MSQCRCTRVVEVRCDLDAGHEGRHEYDHDRRGPWTSGSRLELLERVAGHLPEFLRLHDEHGTGSYGDAEDRLRDALAALDAEKGD